MIAPFTGISRLVGLSAVLGVVVACGSPEQGMPGSAATEPDVVTDTDSLAEAPPTPAFRLAGNEPFWNVMIDSSGLVLRTPDDTVGNRFPATQPIAYGDTLRWNSVNQVSEIEALVIERPCQDTMADKTWTHTARVTIDRRRLEGCAERR